MAVARPRLSVLGVDPGKMTGLCLLDLYQSATAYSKLLGNFRVELIETSERSQQTLPSALKCILRTAHNQPWPLVIVYEQFLITRVTMQTQDVQALEVIGMLKSAQEWWHSSAGIASQAPSQVKPLITTLQLGILGLPTAHVGGHALDAMRHAVFWCSRYTRNEVQFEGFGIPSIVI